MNIQLTDKQKFDTQFIALRHFLNMAEQQEYFDWANQLLEAGVFFHELAMIVSIAYQEPNIFTFDELNENLAIVLRKLEFYYAKHNDVYGKYQAFDKYQAYDDLTYLYCQKIINNEIDFAEAFEEIYWISDDNFCGDVNIWFFLFVRLSTEKYSSAYQAEVLQTMRDYIRYYENGKIIEFYNERIDSE